ncbi:MAG: protein kinase [Myxococcales bacterium]|nr:protein kinase [Myxococcales bacterium]
MPNTQASAQAFVSAGTILGGRYQANQELRATSFGILLAATDTTSGTPVSVHLLREELCAQPDYVEAINQSVVKASQVDHKNVGTVLGAGREGVHAFVVYEPIEGHSLGELLSRKREEGSTFSGKQVSNIAAGLTAAVEACAKIGGHGAITLESITVNKNGGVILADLGLGILAPALVERMGARVSPEVRSGKGPSSQADVYGVGAVVYELLVGVAPEKGCKRPSEAASGISALVDQFVGATTNPDPSKRPTVGQIGPAAQRALTTPSATELRQTSQAVATPARPSLDQSITAPRLDATPLPPGAMSPALIQALSETHDRWLVTKGKLDYGPFPLSAIVEQIQSNQILPGNTLVDNETGNRCKVEDNPLLSDLVDVAKQARDDARRANAEVAHAKQERSRGAFVYVIIVAAIVGIVGGGYLTIKALSSDNTKSSSKKLALDEGSLEAKISFPSKAQASKHRKKHRSKGNGGGSGLAGKAGGWDDSLSFDMAGGDVGSERLSDSQVNPVIQRSGGKLGGCLQRTKTSSAFIEFMVKGTGKVYQVRVNGSTGTPVAKCLRGVMFAMKFPPFDGVRSKHNFDLGF